MNLSYYGSLTRRGIFVLKGYTLGGCISGRMIFFTGLALGLKFVMILGLEGIFLW